MKIRFLLFSILLAVLIASCSSVNNLKSYDLNGKKFYFDEIVGKNANIVQIDNVDNTNSTNTGKSGGDKVIDAIGSIGTAIGRAITENDAREKLLNASDPKSVTDAVSKGIEKTLVQYLNIKTEDNYQGDYDYIVTTTLEELSLKSGNYGVYIHIDVLCTITSRSDSKIVWQQSESESVNLRNGSSASKDSKIFKELDQISSLASLSEVELKNAINNAATEAGRIIANNLREDISEARK